ncbi:LexA family protein [Microbulbifer epialgicus]|uniref:LexA family protein n=1 Tax=Microbulbifer epialgicus TaxID=393907 RepID=A0ABV4P7L0_9GAMM
MQPAYINRQVGDIIQNYRAAGLIIGIHNIRYVVRQPEKGRKETALSLAEYLIANLPATFMARANCDSMQGVGTFDRYVLIIDRSLTPANVDGVVGALDGQLTCKILDRRCG